MTSGKDEKIKKPHLKTSVVKLLYATEIFSGDNFPEQ
jgi:hypothetical protein